MKAPQVNSSKIVLSFTFILLLLTSACTQSGKSKTSESENNPSAKLVVEKPKIDIQAAIISDNLEAVKQHIEAGNRSQQERSNEWLDTIDHGRIF